LKSNIAEGSKVVWKRFSEILCCPACGGGLELRILKEERANLAQAVLEEAERKSVLSDTFCVYVDAGLLLCAHCRVRYPISHGLPVMLPYSTRLHDEFDARWNKPGVAEGYSFSQRTPALGEEFVRESFSTEWLEYDYDGVIWELTYEAHAERIVRELGPALDGAVRWHLEVGCGLGLASHVVQQRSGCDAVGLDLSLASLKAALQYKGNPFMHFVQASAFWIPFAKSQFDLIYSRGVLHHTYSTERAFRNVAQYCKPGGTFYVWLYGPGSIRATPLRVGLYGLEAMTRPLVARTPNSVASKSFLGAMAMGYVAFNKLRRMTNSEIQPLSFARGMHAARDRFTPRFAHRHPPEEVLKWFADLGYASAKVLDWRDMPAAEQDDFSRNVGIRAVRAQ
jgi:SAM-dependent methyltransferase/uncharacterized protein YbaR (Trm112 family)